MEEYFEVVLDNAFGHLIGSHCGYAVGNAGLAYCLELDDTGLKLQAELRSEHGDWVEVESG